MGDFLRPRDSTATVIEEALASLAPLAQACLDRHGEAAAGELRAIFGKRLRDIAPSNGNGKVEPETASETEPEFDEDEVVVAEPDETGEPVEPIFVERKTKRRRRDFARELIPYEARDDTDHIIIELEKSLIRHGVHDINDVFLYLRGISSMNTLFGLFEKRLGDEKNEERETTSTIRRILRTAKIILEASCSIEEQDFIPTGALLALKKLCEEYSVNFLELVPTMSVLSEAKRSGHDRFEDTSLPEEFRGAETMGYDRDPRTAQGYIYNLAVRMSQRGIIYLLMQGILKEHETNGGNSSELRGIYAAGLKQISRQMNPREIRKAPAILHSGSLDKDGFNMAVEKRELPEGMWRQQTEVLQAVSRGLKQGEKRLYFELPAGTGKTLILALLTKLLNPDGNTLVLVPSTHLSLQDQRAFEETLERKDTGLVSGFTAVFDQPITIGTYASFQNYVRRKMFPRDKYGLVLFDEAHRSLSQQRQDIGEYFDQATLIGATASSEDISGRSVSDILKCAYFMSFLDGIKAGVVNSMRVHRVPMPIPAGDEHERAVKKDLENRKATITSLYQRHCKGKQAVVMMDSVARTEAVAEALRGEGINAQALHSKMPRHLTISRDAEFRQGRFSVLCVCEMLTEGWDYPELRFQILGDQIGTEWEVLQRIGRVGRRLEGKDESHIFELRGGVIRRRDSLVELPMQTPLDNVFQNASFAGPKQGFWPKNVFKI
ncbi:DEAD/DEAH box helicase family protein [Candidatus Peregrinibacteria bacterium]|nr:DEAD/DEAH box helicase family protein [Candidatus Peregrinibacteria bacterium]